MRVIILALLCLAAMVSCTKKYTCTCSNINNSTTFNVTVKANGIIAASADCEARSTDSTTCVY